MGQNIYILTTALNLNDKLALSKRRYTRPPPSDNHWSQNDNSQHEDDHDLTDNQSKSTDESEGE